MASTLKPLHRTTRIGFLRFRDQPHPPAVEGPRILGLGCRPHNSNKDGAGPLLRFPSIPRHHACHPLPPLPLRLQVLPPPLRLHLLHQLRPHRPLTMASASSDSSQSTTSTKTVRVMIKGRVQGVFYRNWTIENASQLGLNGWVRNRRDGSVEALFSGKPELVDEMEQRCRRGPPDAMVTALQVVPCNDDPGTGFQRKPTILSLIIIDLGNFEYHGLSISADEEMNDLSGSSFISSCWAAVPNNRYMPKILSAASCSKLLID